MNESIELKDPLFRLIIRFTNGETIQHLLNEPVDARSIPADARYAVITAVSVEQPSDVAEVDIINLRDVSFIKSERVTLESLSGERRRAGIHSDDSHKIKNIAHFKFI